MRHLAEGRFNTRTVAPRYVILCVVRFPRIFSTIQTIPHLLFSPCSPFYSHARPACAREISLTTPYIV